MSGGFLVKRCRFGVGGLICPIFKSYMPQSLLRHFFIHSVFTPSLFSRLATDCPSRLPPHPTSLPPAAIGGDDTFFLLFCSAFTFCPSASAPKDIV
ncbi:hypothetical protein Ahy_B02g059649 isoform B [Arachis hypogaea]|uniref:Uncharacterized protein n=1 Tax=Arachis hypogaea TaxID=3818 RepID=A0A445AH24_ARAHY|nr:hypothetical protein Ahy_B02g059649 isoform B [Arachis hypogaea]